LNNGKKKLKRKATYGGAKRERKIWYPGGEGRGGVSGGSREGESPDFFVFRE